MSPTDGEGPQMTGPQIAAAVVMICRLFWTLRWLSTAASELFECLWSCFLRCRSYRGKPAVHWQSNFTEDRAATKTGGQLEAGERAFHTIVYMND